MNRSTFSFEGCDDSRPLASGLDIAIIGLSGRYPMAADLDEFWSNLAMGRDCVSRLPEQRWRQTHPQFEGMDAVWGGFLDDIDSFDALFFNITPREAAKLDPQERLFLQCAYACIEDAGYTRDTLGRSADSHDPTQNRVGVFVGAMYQEYQLYGLEASLAGDAVASNGVAASIANRVSFFCGFHGPSLTLDTMCSSSVTAIHLACQSLKLQECEVALAGGVNLSLHPNKYRLLKDNRFLSGNGRCRSFASGGDGYVPSEGVGALILKPLAAARRDGDRIHGVIKASAVNHGGHSSGYYVPNADQQASLIREAIDKSGIDARQIQYVEAHGTGTPVGDPIELQGLSQAFGAYTQDKQFCAIGSVKSNLGHSESAAGIAALTKILLQMRHGQLVPSLYADQINPELGFGDSPFYLQEELSAWPRPQDGFGRERERIASLSSYGAGGSNAHLIIAEYIAPTAPAPARDIAPVLVLSAPNAAALQTLAKQLLVFFQSGRASNERALLDCAYTLQVGREAFAHRLGFVACDAAAAIGALARFLAAPDDLPPTLFYGRVKDLAAAAPDVGLSPEQALPGWVRGATVDWAAFYGESKPARIGLPGYPFSRNKIWLKTDTRLAASVASAQTFRAHPLLGTRSDREPAFSSRFSGLESFLADHQIGGSPILPAVAYLEMARAAYQGLYSGSERLSVRKMMWSRPARVGAQPLQTRIVFNGEDGGEQRFSVAAADDDGRYQVCATGIASPELPPASAIDVAALIAAYCPEQRSGEECYRRFARLGLRYGPRHQTIQSLHIGERYVAARLSLPQMEDGYGLHPSLADGAFQAIIGFYPEGEQDDWMPVPFSLESADLYRPCQAEMWCVVTRSAGGSGKAFDIQLLDIDGELCGAFSGLRIKDFSADQPKPAAAAGEAAMSRYVSLAVQWQAQPALRGGAASPGRVLQIGQPWVAESAWDALLGQRLCAPHQALGGMDSCQALLERGGTVDEILWFAPAPGEDLIEDQQAGALGLFRLVKALLAQGAHSRPLSLTVVTRQAQPVREGEPVWASHASVHGLIGVLAKEMRKWRFRLVDDDEAGSLPPAEILRLPHDPYGEAWAWRAGQWHRQRLLACHEELAGRPSAFRREGVYVIVGGAGGIGQALSRYLIERYDAQVVWLGRRGLEQGISQELDGFAGLPRVPSYFQADATDESALRRARQQIEQRFGRIHGVINSAIVLQDQSVMKLDESSFQLVLDVKVASSVNVAKVFADESLDFMLFFSSLVAFLKTAGQSNYAAGSVFQDAFAHKLRCSCGFPVKVMNWGYWGEFGAGASDHYRKRMASNGVASLDSSSGMAALEFLLRSALSQMGFIHMLEFKALEIIPGMQLDQALDISAGFRLVDGVEPILERAEQQLRNLSPDEISGRREGASLGVAAALDLRGRAIAHMNDLVSQALQVPTEDLDEATPLARYGVDSISAVYITNALSEIFGPVDGTLLFELQTIEELAEHFLAQHPASYAAFFQDAAPVAAVPSGPEPVVALPAASLRQRAVAHMRALVSQALEVPAEDLDDSTPLVRYGVDSISAVYITNALSEHFGQVDSSLLFDIQTIDELADHFLASEPERCAELFSGDAYSEAASVIPPAVAEPVARQAAAVEPVALPLLRIHRDDDIAVIGMAGRYPQAFDLAAFWEKLRGGEHCIEEIPAARWDWRLGFSEDPEQVGACYSRWGGFIEGHDEFDPVFFHISPAEAELMDPQERLFLQQAYACVEDAGYTSKALSLHGEVGVFAGVMNSDYPLASRYWSIANRVSYVLDLKGPSLAVDTACSSSLTALHLAIESLRAGSCASALVGGVNLITDPVHLSSLSYMQMLSRGDACRAFGDQADGFVASEGVGVVLLKPLGQARRDGDHVYGVLKGSMIAAGGLTSGYTVPSPRAQSQVIAKSLERAALAPQDVSYIEAHGTGTSLGDPIEIKGLVGAYGAAQELRALGSVKSNIGHAESAAGIAGLCKVLLQIKHGELAPTLHAQTVNPRIDFSQTGLRLVQTAEPWTRLLRQRDGRRGQLPRIAGLSSFGAGGANAHVLIAEDDQAAADPVHTSPCAILLSAQSRDQLRQQADALLRHIIREELSDQHLGRLAFTLQTGRETFEWRMGFIARDMAHLRQRLGELLSCEWEALGWLTVGNGAPRLKTEQPQPANPAPWPEPLLQAQVKRWASGESVDWRAGYDQQPQRLSLPSYPFRRERYWLSPSHDVRRLTPTAEAAVAAPRMPAPQPVQPVLTYREVWREAQAGLTPASAKRIVCLVDVVEHARELAPVLAQAHPGCETLFLLCDGDAQGEKQCIELQGEGQEAFAAAWGEVRRRWTAADLCYHALGACDLYYAERYQSLLHSLQGLLASGLPLRGLLLLARYPDVRQHAQAESWIGFARSLPMVLPGTRVGVLACQDNARASALSLGEWFAVHATPESTLIDLSVCYRGGRRHVAEVEALTLQDAPPIRQAGLTWFISGGLGALARLLWHRLHLQGANVVLTGRSPLSAAQARELEALDKGAGRLLYIQADVSDEVGVRRALQQAKVRYGKIHGVIHAAGAAPTATLEAIDLEDFQRVLAAKVEGTRVLARVFEPESPLWHVQFSSSSATLGDFGSCSYAVANRYQSAFAQSLNKGSGTAHIVIQWPLWRDGAMGLNSSREERFYLDGSGQDYLETDAGLGVFERILAAAEPQTIVLVGANNPLQRRLSGPVRQEAAAVPDIALPIASGQAREAVLAGIEAQLKLPAERIRTGLNWNELGFDSIKLAQLGKQLSQLLGVSLTPATFFGNPSPDDLIRWLNEQQAGKPPLQAVPPPPLKTPADPAAYEPIAIIGVSAQLPGVRSLEQLWDHWRQGVSAIRSASACGGARAQSAGFAGQEGLYGAFLDEVEAFDPLFFELSPAEAAQIDPQQRLFLQAAWHAFEDAGYLGASIRGSQCGVFVGAEESLYGEQLAEVGRINANRNATLSARIAYALNLDGPNYSLTASCSSGLAAVHQACRALQQRECEMALAGGVSLMVSPRELGALADAMPLSPQPVCRVFDQEASGLVPAEAVAAVVLKPLSRALADGDQVYGVIRGSALNHDGRTNGILAPNPVRQGELFARTLSIAGLTSGQIQLAMAHSIGTRLGDPVEIEALQQGFAGARETPCALTSIKPLLGHSFAVSGVVDLLALLLAMRHRRQPPLHGYRQANEYIVFERTGLRPVLAEQDWAVAPGERRRGLISTTGINGSNACLVVEEAPEPPACVAEAEGAPRLVLLSAPDAERLDSLVCDLAEHLERHPSLRLADVAQTLLSGREALECRAAWVVDSLPALRAALAGFSSGGHCYRGDNPILEPQAPMAWPASADRAALETLARRWADGGTLPADADFGGRRVSLPKTRFLRTPCWLAQSRSTAAEPTRPPSANHPGREKLTTDDRDRGDVLVFLRAFCEQHLGLRGEQILPDKPLRQYGMDSVLAIKLGHALEQRYQVRLSARAFHENPSLASLAEHILRQPRTAVSAAETAMFQDERVIAMLERIVNSEQALADVKELLK